jgi:hypothetical protein
MAWIHNDFMLSSFKQMTLLFKSIHNGYKFFIMNLIINLCKIYKNKSQEDEEDCPFKLWEYNTNYKVISVCFLNKRFGRVYVNQSWDSCEKNLQNLKGINNFNSPQKRLIILSQMNKRGHYWRILGNETWIKVSKSKKIGHFKQNFK